MNGVKRSSTQHHFTRDDPMSLKVCFVAAGAALIGMAFARPQLINSVPIATTTDNGSVSNAFIRTASGNGVTVKVCRDAAIWSTSNGSQWTRHPFAIRLHDVTYGNGTFAAVGNEGFLVTSTNGTSWVERNSDTDERLRGIAFGNGLFVAVGYAGVVITSKDGVKWKVRKSGTAERLQMVTFERGKFVALGWKGLTLTSTNGTKWTASNGGTSQVKTPKNRTI
jgi:hypothetical protein